MVLSTNRERIQAIFETKVKRIALYKRLGRSRGMRRIAQQEWKS
jgi:hypothetical protein